MTEKFGYGQEKGPKADRVRGKGCKPPKSIGIPTQTQHNPDDSLMKQF